MGGGITNRNGQRVTVNHIKESFGIVTSPDNTMAILASRKTGKTVLQTRIIKACDPIITIEFLESLARDILKYEKSAWEDIRSRSR